MTNTIEQIEERHACGETLIARGDAAVDNAAWRLVHRDRATLLAEVGRLRKVEEAARDIDTFPAGSAGDDEMAIPSNLLEALHSALENRS